MTAFGHSLACHGTDRLWTYGHWPATGNTGSSARHPAMEPRDWRPQRIFRFAVIRSLFGFASSLLLASLINTCFLNIYSVIIGKLFPQKQLGYYTQGNKMCDMGVSLIYGSIQNATFPIFSTIQNERERLIRAYRKTIRFTAFITLPSWQVCSLRQVPLSVCC